MIIRHVTGDAVLKDIAQKLLHQFKSTEKSAGWAEMEFAYYFETAAEKEELIQKFDAFEKKKFPVCSRFQR